MPFDTDEIIEELPKFSLEEYVAYLKAPQWVLDGCESESEYEQKLCEKVSKWEEASENEFRTEKEIWEICYKALENTNKRAISAEAIFEEAIAQAMIPILKNAMLDDIASLWAGSYVPVAKAILDPAQPMISLLNRFMELEFQLNDWNTLKFELGIDGFVTDISIVKLYTDNEEVGPFGKDERIVLERIEPRNCCPDPKAKRWKWSAMEYFIVKEKAEIGILRNRFPDKASEIDESLANSDDRMTSTRFIMNTKNYKAWGDNERERIDIKECWLHDERMKFRGFMELDDDGKQIIKLDDDGFVDGIWERAYPYGRMVVTAADKVVLRDIPNPYWHKGIPFEFCPLTPNVGKLFNVGKAAAILGLDRKINDIESRVHSYAQSETERPLQAEVGTFPTNMAWYKATGQSNAVMIVNQGKSPLRRAPVEVPQFLIPYLTRLNTYKDQTAGQGGVLGADGSRLSTEAIQMQAGQASNRSSMQSIYISKFMERVGGKMAWLIRETYREDIEVPQQDEKGNPVLDPEGKPVTITWNSKDIPNEYFMSVDIVANQPGGQAQVLQQSLNLKAQGCADRLYVLKSSGMAQSQAEEIDNRMTQREMEEIKATGFGRSLGLAIKQYLNEDDNGSKAPAKGAV